MPFKIRFRWVRISLRGKRKEYLLHKENARKIVHERLVYWNNIYNFKYGKVTIRNQKSRWGSCSKKGNLNFSYKVALLPSHLADYLIVHELCHIGEFNHSTRFWALVGRTIPDYKRLRKELKGVR